MMHQNMTFQTKNIKRN